MCASANPCRTTSATGARADSRFPDRLHSSLTETGARANRKLRQVRVRRDEAGLFVCEIGSILGRPFTDLDGFAGWSYYENYVFGSAAADQLQVKDARPNSLGVLGLWPHHPGEHGPGARAEGRPRPNGGHVHSAGGRARIRWQHEPGHRRLDNGCRFRRRAGQRPLRGDRRQRHLNPPRHARARYRVEQGGYVLEAAAPTCPKGARAAIIGSERADELPGTRGFDVILGFQKGDDHRPPRWRP